MKRACLILWLSLLLIPGPVLAAPDPSVDPAATVVHLRQSCDEQGAPIQNCFESASALWNTTNGWIWFTRIPTAASPLIVDVGPGVFGKFTCNGTTMGNVTVRGSGREVTILEATGATGNAAEIQNCVNLSFMDVGFRGGQYGVKWTGVGNASWTNVDIVTTAASGIAYAWLDVCDGAVPGKSLHYVHGSRVRNSATPSAYLFSWASSCAETWFFGGEILATVSGPTSFASAAVDLESGATLETFGTAIRARVTTGGSASLTLFGAYIQSGSEFHSHGGIISVRVLPAATQSINAVAIQTVGTGNRIHTPGSAFVVEGGSTGTTKRIVSSGSNTIEDVFVWQSGPKPPQSTTETNRISSRNGNDVWIETDCNSAGNCNGGGSETHLMIYNATQCPAANPWFDTQTGACRL